MSQGWRFVLVLFVSIVLTQSALPWARADESPKASAVPETAIAPDSQPDAAPVEKYKLAFKFRPSQIVHQEISYESEMTTHKNQDTEIVRNSSKSRRHHRVLAVDEKSGVGDLEVTVDWVHMLASFDNGEGTNIEPIEFQSDDPNKQPEKFRQILSKIGKHDRLRFSPAGAPVKTSNGAPAKADPAAPVTDGSLEAYLIPLPEQPVAVGDAWLERFDVLTRDINKNPVKISLKRTYTLTQVKNGRAVIELRTAILTPVNDAAIAAQLIEREIVGKVTFDIEHGWIASREWSVDNTIINPVGDNSSMRVKTRYREKLLGSEATAVREAKTRPIHQPGNQPVATSKQ